MASLGSCLSGTPPHLVPAKVAWGFRLGMHLRVSHNFEVMDPEEEFWRRPAKGRLKKCLEGFEKGLRGH